MASLKDAFYSHKLNEDQAKTCEKIREAYFNLALLLDRSIPKSREASLAMTKLEESSMWAIKAVAHDPCNDVVLDSAVSTSEVLPGQLKFDVDIDEEIPEGMPMGEPYNDI